MFANKRIMCMLCLKYAPDCNVDNKQEILNLISAVTIIEFQCNFTFHVCAKCLISLKAAYQMQQRFVRAIQLFISLPEHKKVDHVQKNHVNFQVYKQNICFQEQPIVNTKETVNELLVANEARVKNPEKTINNVLEIEREKFCDLKKFQTREGNGKEGTKIDEPEEVIKYMCVECSATFRTKSNYMLHLKRHFNKGEIDIYLLELIRSKLYGPIKKPIGYRKKILKYGPQKRIPKNNEIIIKDSIKVVENPIKNGETKEKRQGKQSKYVTLVTKIKRKRKGRVIIYKKFEIVPRAELEKMREERAKPKEEQRRTIWDIMNEEPPMEQPTEKPVESKEKVVCEICSNLVNMKLHKCPKILLICEYCGEDILSRFKGHHTCYKLAKHAKREPVQCTIDFTPKSKRSFWDVMNEEPAEEPPCKTEKAQCQDCSAFMDMNLHKCPNRMILCEYCGVALTARTCRPHFLSRHSRGRVVKCNICGQVCSNQIQLYRHKKKHRPKQEFVCSYCGKNFPRSTTMRVHERQHTNEAPYKCDICGEAFKQNVLLRRHRGSIHKLFETLVCACDKCGKEFASHMALESHIARVHNSTESKAHS